MKRRIFSEEHEIFRTSFRKFWQNEAVPRYEEWEKAGVATRDIWLKAGENGFLCPFLPEEYGGYGADFLYSVVILEESAKAFDRGCGLGIGLHNDVVAPYLLSFGNEEQKKRWLPKCTTGETILAVAMTEPDAGSDLAAIRTTAIRDGDNYIVNGSKTFITNGLLSDLVVVAVKTDPNSDPPHRGVSLLVVERGMKGFERGNKIPKIGIPAQDTAELFFNDCVVPMENLLGEEGAGFIYLMQKLQQERLVVAIGNQAAAEAILDLCIEWCWDRKAFGKPLAAFQHTRFKLAEMATEIEIGRAFVDRLIEEHMKGENIVTETSMGKYWVPEMLKRVVDDGVQLHGGYGYSTEYQIAKSYMDARVNTIYAGTSEIMLEIISRTLKP